MNLLLLCLCLGISLSFCILELYTILKAYFSNPKWIIKINYNQYHEGYFEIFLFTSILFLNIYTIFFS